MKLSYLHCLFWRYAAFQRCQQKLVITAPLKASLYSQKIFQKPKSTFCYLILGCTNKLAVCSLFEGTYNLIGKPSWLLDWVDLRRDHSKSPLRAPTAYRTVCFQQERLRARHTQTQVYSDTFTALWEAYSDRSHTNSSSRKNGSWHSSGSDNVG